MPPISSGERNPPEIRRGPRQGLAEIDLTKCSRSTLKYRPSFSELQSVEIGRLQRQRWVEQICRIPELVFKLLDEIDRPHGLGEDLGRLLNLNKYAAVHTKILTALGTDRLPPSPLRIMRGGAHGHARRVRQLGREREIVLANCKQRHPCQAMAQIFSPTVPNGLWPHEGAL